MHGAATNGQVELYKLAAQVIPVLWFAALFETRTLQFQADTASVDRDEPSPSGVAVAIVVVLLGLSAASETAALYGVAADTDHWLLTVAVVGGLMIGGMLVLAPIAAAWTSPYLSAQLRRRFGGWVGK